MLSLSIRSAHCHSRSASRARAAISSGEKTPLKVTKPSRAYRSRYASMERPPHTSALAIATLPFNGKSVYHGEARRPGALLLLFQFAIVFGDERFDVAGHGQQLFPLLLI